MPIDRVIALIETQANTAGIEKAQAGFAGLNAGTIGLGIALGGLVMVGKSAIENTEAMTKAHKSLAQAIDVSKFGFWDLQGEFDAWAETNKRYIANQYDAETALAAFVRAGADGKDAMRELNDALDLSTLRGMSMDEAQKSITLALTGSSKALKVLGITTAEYNAIMHDKTLSVEQQHLALLKLIESKTKDGRKAQTDLSQSTNALNKDWQDISTRVGPPLLELITFIASEVDRLVKGLMDLGANKDWNIAVSLGLGHIQDALVGVVKGFEALVSAVQWLGDHADLGAKFLGGGGARSSASRPVPIPTAGGYEGMVSQPTLFLAGEAGPENVSIRPRGSAGGGNTIIIHVDRGAYIDGPSIDTLANAVALRLGFASGR